LEGWRFATIEVIKLHPWKCSRLYQKALIRSASRIGKNAGTSVLYLRGISLKGQYRY
jgi:hypothetical protein